VPLNLVGDMAGGGLLLAYGIMAALLERTRSGRGQVVDASMLDGAAQLMASMAEAAAGGLLGARGTTFVDGGLPNYTTYPCADGRFVSVGSFEPKFLARLCAVAEVDPELARADPIAFRRHLAELFASRSRDEWDALLGKDPELCFAPVLEFHEAPTHPHVRARGTYEHRDGVLHPAPAPRLERTPARAGEAAPRSGEHTAEVLREFLGGAVQA
jgi:alpha-methylacyl-CoA racemase